MTAGHIRNRQKLVVDRRSSRQRSASENDRWPSNLTAKSKEGFERAYKSRRGSDEVTRPQFFLKCTQTDLDHYINNASPDDDIAPEAKQGEAKFIAARGEAVELCARLGVSPHVVW